MRRVSSARRCWRSCADFAGAIDAVCYDVGMDYQHYCDAMQRVSDQVDAGKYDDAIAGLTVLLNSDLLEADKAVLCLNMAVIYDKLQKPRDVQGWYERGMDYERSYRRYMVAEHRAGWLYTSGQLDEALSAFQALARDRSIAEADKQRLDHNVAALREQMGR